MMNQNMQTNPYGLFLLDPMDYHKVAPWFDAIDGAAIRLDSVAKAGGGRLWVDDAIIPTAALLEADDGFCYLAGPAESESFAAAAVSHLLRESLPNRPAGDRQAIVFSASARWKAAVDAQLAPHGGFMIRRHTFAFDGAAFHRVQAALPALPEGYTLCDSGFLGAAVLFGGSEAARCCAVFAGAGQAEMDVFTDEAHRRKGLALHAGIRAIGRCLEAGFAPHWSCWDYNTPSVGLALRLGFRQLPDLEVSFCDLG